MFNFFQQNLFKIERLCEKYAVCIIYAFKGDLQVRKSHWFKSIHVINPKNTLLILYMSKVFLGFMKYLSSFTCLQMS